MQNKGRVRDTTTKFFVEALKEEKEVTDDTLITNISSEIEEQVYILTGNE